MRISYKHIIFDLDGTLSDSREGIFNAYSYTIDRLHLTTPPPGLMLSLIGPPLQKGFADVFGLRGEANKNAVKVFREYYASKGLFENKLYEGIKLLLEDLVLEDANVFVATSKYIVYAEQVLDYFGIASYFKEIAGADYEGKHAGKTDMIAGILRRNNIHDPLEVVVIGDTRYDIDAANELDIESVGVTYGFSSPEEIASYNPDYIVNTVQGLRDILLTE